MPNSDAKQKHMLSESLGDYIEHVYHLVREKGAARVKDIADRMSVQMSSVTGAMKALAAKHLVNYDPYSLITLTAEGEDVARELVQRHEALSQFFSEVLGLDPDAADRNACHMEHAIEPEAMERLSEFLKTNSNKELP